MSACVYGCMCECVSLRVEDRSDALGTGLAAALMDDSYLFHHHKESLVRSTLAGEMGFVANNACNDGLGVWGVGDRGQILVSSFDDARISFSFFLFRFYIFRYPSG